MILCSRSLFTLTCHSHIHLVILLVIDQTNRIIYQRLPIQQDLFDVTGYVVRVVHLDEIYGYSVLVAGFKPIPAGGITGATCGA